MKNKNEILSLHYLCYNVVFVSEKIISLFYFKGNEEKLVYNTLRQLLSVN